MFEYLSIGTILLVVANSRVSPDSDFWAKHYYNLANMCYQAGIIIGYFSVKLFTFPGYAVLPGVQMAICVLFAFLYLYGRSRRTNAQSK